MKNFKMPSRKKSRIFINIRKRSNKEWKNR